ncbi:MAG: Holliday junction resolvase RuvX [Ruminococcaceae bacterium]|nr:Holliday junction resolvase RuvX [Oscillospiraceae bacterium]
MSLETVKATTGRVLGVDYGEARTGLAISDATRFLANGIGNVQGGGLEKTAARVLEAAAEQGAVAVVLGLPVNMNGTEGPKAARVRELAALIEEKLPVYLMDERMTTMSAARYLNETNTRGKKRKGVIDTLSAQIILQNALDRLR